jgi:two-component sensor histidine kinase
VSDSPSTRPDVGLKLAFALVDSSDAPLLLLNGDLTVAAANGSFFSEFAIDPEAIDDWSIFSLGAGEWDAPRLRSLLDAIVSGLAKIDTCEIDLKRSGLPTRLLALKAHKLDYGEGEPVLVLLTISDVTEARIAERLKDDLVREQAFLLQGVQHRVANSLQIIASVLMQSARKVQSEETRSHLRDAHSRVMSIASVHRQLAGSAVGDVDLRAYIVQLCQSLGASMIQDPVKLRLTAVVDESSVGANVSTGLGLVVTELVINALKHAYPDERGGNIVVRYSSSATAWVLSVSDDGDGMAKGLGAAKAGLGTSIVEALAKQLHAKVAVTDAHPGTQVLLAGNRDSAKRYAAGNERELIAV